MKKISIILAIVLCASVFFCVPVSATGEEVRLYVKASGTEVTALVKTSAAVGAIQGAIKYEESDFDYDSANATAGIAANNATASSFQDVEGATKFALVGNPSSGTSGEWATLKYSADEGTKTNFEFSSVKAFDANGAKLDPSVVVIRPGDFNEDKVVDVYDYVRYKRICLNLTENPSVVLNMDVNMDGCYARPDTTDYAQLQKDLLGY